MFFFLNLLESGTWGVPGSDEKEVWTFNDLMPQIEEVFFFAFGLVAG